MKEKIETRKLTGFIRIKLDRDDHSCGLYWESTKEAIVEAIGDVVDNFTGQGYTLTLRQLYYQLVQMNIVPNDDKVYKKLSGLLDDCRYSGVVNWAAFEDRGRIPTTPYFENSIADALGRTYRSFSLDRREGQQTHLEVWTEKDAISSILKDAVRPYTTTVSVNKGFASSTAIHAAYLRFVGVLLEGRNVKVLYFGDHDPSGLDMIRDMRYRLLNMLCNGDNREALWRMFDLTSDDASNRITQVITDSDDLAQEYYKVMDMKESNPLRHDAMMEVTLKCLLSSMFEVKHIGLTMEQVDAYDLPHNPAKLSDPRAKWYVNNFGNVSWEVDALQPAVIEQIVVRELEACMDMGIYRGRLKKEEEDKSKLKEILDTLNK